MFFELDRKNPESRDASLDGVSHSVRVLATDYVLASVFQLDKYALVPVAVVAEV